MPASLPPDIEIRTERLRLRLPRESDIPETVRGIGDFAVARMLTRVPHPYDEADARAWIASVAEKIAAGTDLPLVIENEGSVIGGLGIHGIGGSGNGAASDFGYWLAQPAWGKGFATEAGRAALAYAFDRLGFALIRSGVLIDNPASLRVQEKLHFVRIGVRDVDCLARGGKVAHIDTMLTRERFQEAHP